MRSLSAIDKFIDHVDSALKTLAPGASSAHRVSPAQAEPHAQLDAPQQKHAAGLMRINHSGEVCAQALYRGQSLSARLPEVRAAMEEAAAEEVDHLVWCEQRLGELNSHSSILNPAFYAMSYSVGALAGALGDKWSLGFVAATEHQVCAHLSAHLEQLPEQDLRSRAILEGMYEDELRHATTAIEAGGVVFPGWFQAGMTIMSKVMTKTCYRI
ncbi:MAG: 2-polyprenyl-3-methyl-6-methoxy-1,4-benzoquinone monooxygenase [Bermanella sp.]